MSVISRISSAFVLGVELVTLASCSHAALPNPGGKMELWCADSQDNTLPGAPMKDAFFVSLSYLLRANQAGFNVALAAKLPAPTGSVLDANGGMAITGKGQYRPGDFPGTNLVLQVNRGDSMPPSRFPINECVTNVPNGKQVLQEAGYGAMQGEQVINVALMGDPLPAAP